MRISSKSPAPSEAFADESSVEVFDEPALKTSPDEIDARRAHQLLERAASLAARGDLGAAILATRQSLALSPGNVEGHLLLARFLERNRDFGGARAAYEKSVQLAPDRADARAHLARIDAYLQQSQGAARQFHFDEEELFAPEAEDFDDDATSAMSEQKPGETPVNSTPVVAAPVVSPAESVPTEIVLAEGALGETVSLDMLDETMLPVIEARLPPAREETSAAPKPEARAKAPIGAASNANRNVERRQNNVPVAVERRRRPAAVVPLAATAIPLAPAPLRAPVAANVLAPTTPTASASANLFDAGINAGVPLRAPLDLNLSAAPAAPIWRQVMARPSFYARTLPLVGVALLSLGFLSWARGRAVSQSAATAPTQMVQTSSGGQIVPETPFQNTTTSGAPANITTSNGTLANRDANGFPISNAPFTFPAAPTNNNTNNAAPSNNAPSTTARAGNRGANRGTATTRLPRRVSPRAVPNFPGVSLAPAPIPPARVRNATSGANQNNGGSSIILPRPSVDLPSAPEPRQRVLPPDDSGLNPAGAPGRGYVRITEGRVGNGVIPAQPAGVARQNESNANDAARNGQTDQAISLLSQAIRADGNNAGFRYQQRATLFLQRGDYNRATDDFQSAISAYQTQINNGDDVTQARRGLNSARSGLNLALAGKRG